MLVSALPLERKSSLHLDGFEDDSTNAKEGLLVSVPFALVGVVLVAVVVDVVAVVGGQVLLVVFIRAMYINYIIKGKLVFVS